MDRRLPDRGRAAASALRTVARVCDEKLGWNRIGFLLSILVIVVVAAALAHILHDIDLHEVIDAFLESDRSNIAWASLCVAGSYFTLTFYDLFALRTIGRADVPYRVAALAS